MEDFTLEVKNYRCFPDSNPLRLKVSPGFTSFVGVNNAGKSVILRFFWEFHPLLRHLSEPLGNICTALNGNAQTNIQLYTSLGEQAFSILNKRDMEFRVRWSAPLLSDPDRGPIPHEVLISVPRDNSGYTAAISINNTRRAFQGDVKFENGTHLVSPSSSPIDLGPFFEACRFMGKAIYFGSFRNTVNVGGQESYYGIAVGQKFVKEFHHYKSGPDPQANEAVHRLIEDIKRIFGFADFDINASPDQETLQLIIDGRSFRLSELGSGIAQFILVLANVLVKRPSVVLIDEPEASLHPTLQLDFLTTLASYSSEQSVMFATHNLGLARAASERIYSCKRLALGKSDVKPLEATTHLGEFLGELGYSAYRDLGYESVLLVEGPTDVKTFQQFLRLYGKDHKVVLLSLGGSSMINGGAETELAEVKRIAPNVSAIIDSERETGGARLSPGRAAFIEISKSLGIRTVVLERRAIEHYLTDHAVKSVFGDKYRALEPFQSLCDRTPSWGKYDNWRLAREMKRSDLDGTDLGEFLSAL